MVEGCARKSTQIFLFIFNFCMWAIGAALIGGSAYLMIASDKYSGTIMDNDSIRVVASIGFGVGALIFVVGFCGCAGALTESKCLLITYLVSIIIIILLQLTAGILAACYKDDIYVSMKSVMTTTIHNDYGRLEVPTDMIDDWQRRFDCCGATNYTDYEGALYFNSNQSVPMSCCNGRNDTLCVLGTKGQPLYPEYVWSQGCVDAHQDAMKGQLILIIVVAVGFILFQVLMAVFTCYVISGINKNSYDKFA